jgi:hypothetical protein
LGLPEVVERAVDLARSMNLDFSCHPAQGRLLALLAGGRPGSVIGETGTGCGVGVAWMLSAADPSTRLVSVEQDPTRAKAARDLFGEYEQVQVLSGDWRLLLAHGPFDLLVLDGGGNGKTLDDERVEPGRHFGAAAPSSLMTGHRGMCGRQARLGSSPTRGCSGSNIQTCSPARFDSHRH